MGSIWIGFGTGDRTSQGRLVEPDADLRDARCAACLLPGCRGGIVKTCGSACHALLSPAVLLTTLIFAIILGVVKSSGGIRGGRAPGVQWR